MCDTCLAYRVGNLTEEAFNQHLAEKDAALNEKQNDKENTPKTTLYQFHIKLALVYIKVSICTSKWLFMNGITFINAQFDVHIAILMYTCDNLM